MTDPWLLVKYSLIRGINQLIGPLRVYIPAEMVIGVLENFDLYSDVLVPLKIIKFS